MTTTKIALLGVLHSWHNEVKVFSLEHLNTAIHRLKPDIICVELMPSEIKSDFSQPYKIEYSVILPYGFNHSIKIEGLDPEEPLYTRMVQDYQRNQKRLFEASLPEAQVLKTYQKQLFDYLINEHWESLEMTQSRLTHELFRLKHRFQDELMGQPEKDGWETFNSYYTNRISEIALRNPGLRVLVTIGLEHIYWLQDELEKNAAFEILVVEDLLKY